jgi:hypothetical protein
VEKKRKKKKTSGRSRAEKKLQNAKIGHWMTPPGMF